MRATCYVSLAVWLFAGAQVYGQFQGQFSSRSGTQEFRGRLLDGADHNYDGYAIEISNPLDRSNPIRTEVFSDGTFSLFAPSVTEKYVVRVLTIYGAEVTTSVTSIGPSSAGTTFEIRLPQQKLQRPASGTVSIQQLNHPLSKQERKLLDRGQKLIDEQRYSEAAARLRLAVQDDSQCSQAHAQLGLALSKLESWDGAIEEYRAATALDPGNAVLHSNLSAVLASAKRFDEARERGFGCATQLDPRNPRAHYVLAATLLHEPGRLEEVVSHLAAAQDSFPSARTALAQVCAARNLKGCP